MRIRRDILLRTALVGVLTASAGAGSVLAGEKIIFSGRDGRQAQYHRSLNARPLFVAPQIGKAIGNGESPLDAFNAPPAMMFESRRKQASDDKDWIFESPEELGAEGAEKEFLGEGKEFEKDGFNRTPAERYLDRKREKREKSLKGDDAKDAVEKLNEAVKELDKDPLLADLKATQLSRSKLGGSKSAVDLATESRSASQTFSGLGGTLGGSRGGADIAGKAFIEYQRAHIDKFKQTLGVSAVLGNRPGSGAGFSQGPAGDLKAPMAGAASPFGQPTPGAPGAYPGSRGLGLKALTTPTATPGFAPVPGPARNPAPTARERYKPSRLKQPKRSNF